MDFAKILADSARPHPTPETDAVRGRMIAAHNAQVRERDRLRDLYQRDEFGRVSHAVLFALLVLSVAGFALRCHPQLPPVAGCTPGAESCVRDQPHVCSGSQRWEPRGDEACGAVLEGESPRACVVLDNGAARCRTLRDGGSDADQ